MPRMSSEKLSPDQKELLMKFVGFICENCHKLFDKNQLEIHRIKRGNSGGQYSLRNVMIVCSKCHSLFHSGEFG